MTDETTLPDDIPGVELPPEEYSSGSSDTETLQEPGVEQPPEEYNSGFTDTETLQDENLEDNIDEQSIQDQDAAEESPQTTPPPQPSKRRQGVMEYDLEDMYPEIGILVSKSRREWNFHDPDIIRALWLESKTNVIEEWKIKHSKIAKGKEPNAEVVLNHTAQLRLEFLKQKEEQRKAEYRKYHHAVAMGKLAPHFDTVKMATTHTTELRHKFNRNNPPIPSYYINHYNKYKKPPFKTKVNSSRGCLPE